MARIQKRVLQCIDNCPNLSKKNIYLPCITQYFINKLIPRVATKFMNTQYKICVCRHRAFKDNILD